MDILQRIKIL